LSGELTIIRQYFAIRKVVAMFIVATVVAASLSEPHIDNFAIYI